MDAVSLSLALFLGLAVGFGIAWVLARGQSRTLSERLAAKESECGTAQSDLVTVKEDRARLTAQAARVPELEAIVERRDEHITGLNAEIAEFDAKRREQEASIAQKEVNLNEQIALLMKAKEELSKAFSEASQEVLAKNNKLFLQLADENLKQRETAVAEIVKPVKESLDKLDKQSQELESKRVEAYATLGEQVKVLVESQSKLQGETNNLVRALRAPHQRGRWGEIQLKRVVEMAGMLEHCDFTEQEAVEGGALRPDLVVKLPGNKRIVVDSKAPLDAYLSAIEATSDDDRTAQMKRHAQQVRRHVQQLSTKQYWSQFASAEFVVLFLPGEPFFSAALEHDPELIEYGVANRVIVGTPTTLIALLKAAAYGWNQESLTENAAQISEAGKELYSRVCKMTEVYAKVGRNLDSTVKAYNESVGSLEGRVLPQARRFKVLQATRGEELPTLEPVERTARGLTAPEMVSLPGMEEPETDL